MKKTIYIADVQEKASGYGAKGKWTIYSVLGNDKIYYSTFESKYVSMVGQEVDVEVEEKDGKKINPKTNEPYKNWWIIEPKKNFGLQDVWDAIQDLRDRVGTLELMKKSIQKKADDEVNEKGEDTELPF